MPAQIRTKYEADSGLIHSMRMSPAYEAVAGTEPAGVTNSRIKVQISKGNKEHGLRPRGVRLARTVGAAPNTFVKYTFLPLRSQDDATAAAYQNEATLSIDGVEWTVIGFEREDY